MGDVILSTPVLTAVKQRYPDAYIAMMVQPYARELVEGHPDVDEVLHDDINGDHQGLRRFFRLVADLKKHRFDVAIVLHPTLRLALLVFLARIPLRVGTGYRAYSLLFNKRVFHHRKHSDNHELDLNLELLQAIGVENQDFDFKFHIPQNAEETIEQVLRKRKTPGQPLVVLHAGSGGSARDWSAERFGQLALKLKKELNACVVLSGVKTEKELADRVQTTAQTELVRLDGKLSIKELAALLRKADLLIANSTGPLHLAVAVGTQVIGLFCPIKPCLPNRWGPYDVRTRTYQKDSVIMPAVSECDKCLGQDCDHWDCMDLISVVQVFELARKKLKIYNDASRGA